MEGWTTGNNDLDKFIKDTMYDARHRAFDKFIEWVPFDRFENINLIGEGGFAKVFSAIWIDGKANYIKQDDGSWKKNEPSPMKVALKRLNKSQNLSAKYLNELKSHWDLISKSSSKLTLRFYGITKDPETQEFMMILQFADQGNLRSFLKRNSNILWNVKLFILRGIASDLKILHGLGYFHGDLHSGNILQISKVNINYHAYISDFGLSGPSNKQESDDNKYGVLPYIAPEVLNKQPFKLSSDIYSLGVIMAELSSGKPPFNGRKHDEHLSLEICNGLRPEFGIGTPEIYKELSYKCMNADPDQRPAINEICNMINVWFNSLYGSYQELKYRGYNGKEIKDMFEKANEEIPNITSSSEHPGAIYISRSLNNFTNSYDENNKGDYIK